MSSFSTKEKIASFLTFIAPTLGLSFIALQARLRNFFRLKFNLESTANMGVNTLFIFFSLFTLWRLGSECGKALADRSTNHWKHDLPPQRYFLYNGLQIGALTLYISLAIGEILALAVGGSLKSTLPVTLMASYSIFIIYDIIQIVKIYDSLQHKSTPKRKIGLQNEVISTFIDLSLLLIGLTISLFFPEWIIVAAILIILQVINPFIPKDGLRKIFFKEINTEEICNGITNDYNSIQTQLGMQKTERPENPFRSEPQFNQHASINHHENPSRFSYEEKKVYSTNQNTHPQFQTQFNLGGNN